ncbi:MAG: hypothetical protein GF334_11520 [Candidatus Altiarchaeales archaeon]|nr:hypothetical protein [Candidatus Altiarchaeales archaeon]
MRIYAMVVPQPLGKKLAGYIMPLADKLASFMPALKTDLALSDIDMTPPEYVGASISSAVILASIIFLGVFISLTQMDPPYPQAHLLAAVPALLLFFFDFLILLRYPHILAVKRGQLVERDLIYALKDLLLHMSSGLTLYESMARVSHAEHGYVSQDFHEVIIETNEGVPFDEALERLALRSSSDYMRNSIWQIINAFNSGASVKEALNSIVTTLINEQKRKIRDYTQELNMLTMFYMVFAVAIPTVVTTVLVVLTSFVGTGVSPELYLFVVLTCILVQIFLVVIVKSRRPLVYFA